MSAAKNSHRSRLKAPAGGSRVAFIDGLRAIAVLAVVAYHAGVPGFSGGFVGVDVFFVISGYLIINHIVTEMAAGTFSFAQFYARRTLRLFPPLFIVIAATTFAASIILVSPYEWEWFSLSGVTSALFASNIYFLAKQGYFDIDAFEKPLLHVWSLSVEEQFYLIVPLLLAGCFAFAMRRRLDVYRVLAILAGVVFIVSLIGCIARTHVTGRNEAFYLVHWRAWEFAAGGAIGFLGSKGFTGGQRLYANVAGFAGLMLIVASAVLLNDRAAFPGYLAILPVAGAALALAGGQIAPNAAAVRLLSLAPLPYIGLVSYGWYLWHWPLISLARMAQFGDASLLRDVAMAVLSFGLAVATFYLVERPARRLRERANLARSGMTFVAAGIAASLGLAAVVGAVSGFFYWHTMKDPALVASVDRFIAGSACGETRCVGAKGQRGLLIGDSHSDRIEATLAREARKYGASIRQIKDSGQPPDADFAVLFYRWNSKPELYNNLERQFERLLQNPNERILLIGPVPEFRYKAANCVLRAQRYGEDWDRCALPRAELEARRAGAIGALKRLAAKYPNVRLADPFALFCDASLCRPYENGAMLHKDTDHLTIPYGAEWLYYRFKEDFWWAMSGAATDAARKP
jgi:peptidoglycan/LPS O-acetylase OafA/YrhL